MKNKDKSYAIIYLNVENMLILGSNDYMMKSTKKILTNKFFIKDLNVADVILELKMIKPFDGLILSQSHYIEEIFDKFSIGENSIVKISMDISVHISKNKGKGMDRL
jgi:hypothetical protein